MLEIMFPHLFTRGSMEEVDDDNDIQMDTGDVVGNIDSQIFAADDEVMEELRHWGDALAGPSTSVD